MKKIMFIFCMVSVLLMAVSASADTITYPITVPDSALLPYPGPYANVLVDRTDPTHATITMTALTPFAIGDGRSFDLNPNGPVTWSGLTSGFSLHVAPPPNVAPGFGDFILLFDDGNGFSSPKFIVSVMLALTSGTWSTASNVLSPNIEGFVLAAHIGVPSPPAPPGESTYPVTGWAGNGQPIPEPATMLLLGSGLIGLAGLARKRFKK